MCKPKPGKRCAAHTRTAYDTLRAEADEVFARNDPDEVRQMLWRITRNRMDFFATRTGRAELSAQLADSEPGTTRHDAALHNLALGQQITALRKHAVALCDSNPAASKAERAELADRCQEELYLQAHYWDETHRPDSLGITADTAQYTPALRRAAHARRQYAEQHGFGDYPAGALPVTRCDGCGRFADDTHQCTKKAPVLLRNQPHHPLAVAPDTPTTFAYMHRPGSSYTDVADPAAFGRDVEPAGRYLSAHTPGAAVPDGWETGTLETARPLHVAFGAGYDSAGNWKRELSAHYGGLTGAALSQAIRDDGYDLIVTHDQYGTSETVDLTSFTPAPATAGPVDGEGATATVPGYEPVTACPDGWVDLYHRTTPAAADQIWQDKTMTSRENTPEVFFSTAPDSDQTRGYGDGVVMIRVPADQIAVDDEFPDGEIHYRVPVAAITADTLMRRCGDCGRWTGAAHTCTTQQAWSGWDRTTRHSPREANTLGTVLGAAHGVDLYLRKGRRDDDPVVLAEIRVPEDRRGKGVGKAAMADLLAEADRNGWTIALTPDGAYGSSKTRLTNWYKSLGFVANKGRAKDYRVNESMIRPPQTS